MLTRLWKELFPKNPFRWALPAALLEAGKRHWPGLSHQSLFYLLAGEERWVSIFSLFGGELCGFPTEKTKASH